MALAYAREKLREAVRVLATHPGNIEERLGDALVPHIGSIDIKRDVPEELREEYQEFRESVTPGTSVSGEGTLHASVREMSSVEAVETAKPIYRPAYEFQALLDEQRRRA